MILRKRAEEITELVRKTKDEISVTDDEISGDIYIGAGETDGIRFMAKAAKSLQNQYPLVHFHIFSGDKTTVVEQLDKGLLDFGVLFGAIDKSKYDYIKIKYNDIYGVLLRKDDPLAQRAAISVNDLYDKPLIISRQIIQDNNFSYIFKRSANQLNIVATYNLLFNASIMVDEGLGYAIGFDKIINVTGYSNLCFRPLENQPEVPMFFVWKKYQTFAKASEKFLDKLQEMYN